MARDCIKIENGVHTLRGGVGINAANACYISTEPIPNVGAIANGFIMPFIVRPGFREIVRQDERGEIIFAADVSADELRDAIRYLIPQVTSMAELCLGAPVAQETLLADWYKS